MTGCDESIVIVVVVVSVVVVGVVVVVVVVLVTVDRKTLRPPSRWQTRMAAVSGNVLSVVTWDIIIIIIIITAYSGASAWRE